MSAETAAAQGASALIVLIDDVRVFRDGRPSLVVQTSAEALILLGRLAGRRIDELWLDYDLLGGDTSRPVVEHLVATAQIGKPVDIARIIVHSSCVPEGLHITTALRAAGYRVERSHALGIWARRSLATPTANHLQTGQPR